MYSYTGNTFTDVSGAYTTADRVTGTFTLGAPLAANLGWSMFKPTAYSFSDGVQTIDQASDVGDGEFYFSTNNGQVTNVSILLVGNLVTLPDIYISGSGDSGYAYVMGSGRSSVPGTFSVAGTTVAPAATPEPSSLALLGTGTVGVAGFMRRRFVSRGEV